MTIDLNYYNVVDFHGEESDYKNCVDISAVGQNYAVGDTRSFFLARIPKRMLPDLVAAIEPFLPVEEPSGKEGR